MRRYVIEGFTSKWVKDHDEYKTVMRLDFDNIDDAAAMLELLLVHIDDKVYPTILFRLVAEDVKAGA